MLNVIYYDWDKQKSFYSAKDAGKNRLKTIINLIKKELN
jgi:hypothetical protein